MSDELDDLLGMARGTYDRAQQKAREMHSQPEPEYEYVNIQEPNYWTPQELAIILHGFHIIRVAMEDTIQMDALLATICHAGYFGTDAPFMKYEDITWVDATDVLERAERTAVRMANYYSGHETKWTPAYSEKWLLVKDESGRNQQDTEDVIRLAIVQACGAANFNGWDLAGGFDDDELDGPAEDLCDGFELHEYVKYDIEIWGA